MRLLLFLAALLTLVPAACAMADVDDADADVDVDALVAPGELLYARGQFDSARAVWAEALARVDVAGSASEARLHTWLGLAAWRLGEYSEARRFGERGLELAQQLELDADVTQARNALGLLAWHEGRLADAAPLFDAALADYMRQRDAAGIARVSNNLGLVSYDLGRFDEARAAFSAARDTARALDNALMEGRVLANLGMLEIWTGDPLHALDVLAAARVRAEAAADVVGLASALGQTGVAHTVLGQPGLALAALDSALSIARANGIRDEEANDLVIVAGIYADAGDTEQALRTYAAARQINEDLGLAIEAGTVLREEAVLRAARGALERARGDAVQALALHRGAGAAREELLDLLALVDIDRRAGEGAAAEQRLREARRLAAQLGTASARLGIAIAEARVAIEAGDATRALSVLAAVEPELPRAGPVVDAEANALRLRAWMELGQLDSAVIAGRRAVAAIETVRDGFASGPLRTSYVADRSRVYADLVMALLWQGETAQAFAVADAARGRAIVEHLAATRAEVRRNVALRDLVDAERMLRRIDQLLAQLAREETVPPSERGAAHFAASEELLRHLERARSEYGALLVRAAERDPRRARLVGALPTDAADVRAALHADEAILEYLVTADRLFIFMLTRDSLHVVTHDVGRDELIHKVQLARELLAAPHRLDRERAVSEALYDLLIRALGSHDAFAALRHLFIVPHGALAYLPFASLRDADTGRLLVDRFTLSHLPSAGVLPMLRSRRPEPVAAGAAAFAPFPERLPSTVAEAEAVRRALAGATASSGRRASEAAVRRALREGRLVHVATHGVMNARNPLFSRIELAPGRTGSADDGRLEVHELLDLEIASPLVFLSGCETGLGSAWATAFDHGEDFATLAQAFLLAGAGDVVATLWRIDDAGATAFAERFYHHLTGSSPVDALAAAQRDLRADPRWRSPYYWAAYTLSGAVSNRAAQSRQPAAVQ